MSPTNPDRFTSYACANTMLLGEHSVVQGYPALVATLPPQIRIHWHRRNDDLLVIHSALGDYQAQINHLTPCTALRFVLAPLQRYADQLQTGWTLTIESDFPSDWGLGSSAAVLAACITGLAHLLNKHWTIWQKFEIGHRCILTIQGRGSGADLAACLVGGLVYFEPNKKRITRLDYPLELCLVYAGYKTPTAEVLAQVAATWKSQPQALAALYQHMGDLTLLAKQAIDRHDNAALYQAIAAYQQAMQQLGVSDATLETLHARLKDYVPAAKISGSGLGDCLLGIGHLPPSAFTAFLNSQITPCAAGIMQTQPVKSDD